MITADSGLIIFNISLPVKSGKLKSKKIKSNTCPLIRLMHSNPDVDVVTLLIESILLQKCSIKSQIKGSSSTIRHFIIHPINNLFRQAIYSIHTKNKY